MNNYSLTTRDKIRWQTMCQPCRCKEPLPDFPITPLCPPKHRDDLPGAWLHGAGHVLNGYPEVQANAPCAGTSGGGLPPPCAVRSGFQDCLAPTPLHPAMLVDQGRHCARHNAFGRMNRTNRFRLFGDTNIRPEAWYGRHILHNALHWGKPSYV